MPETPAIEYNSYTDYLMAYDLSEEIEEAIANSINENSLGVSVDDVKTGLDTLRAGVGFFVTHLLSQNSAGKLVLATESTIQVINDASINIWNGIRGTPYLIIPPATQNRKTCAKNRSRCRSRRTPPYRPARQPQAAHVLL